jgi:hypothetical protein
MFSCEPDFPQDTDLSYSRLRFIAFRLLRDDREDAVCNCGSGGFPCAFWNRSLARPATKTKTPARQARKSATKSIRNASGFVRSLSSEASKFHPGAISLQ